MAPRPALRRIVERPNAEQWDDDELLSMAEAARLFFPRGPLDADSLRLAVRRGELAATCACGKLFTTPSALKAFIRPQRAGID